ncbi:serine hydrolase domain-containing protein [Kribbella ginsengisoli]|uniref:Serine hydrolase domain-containing protein n=1 Tax=Kribbella ginsengisoli TaxID=363865 RepID=A0ABP6XX98_9ACTN
MKRTLRMSVAGVAVLAALTVSAAPAGAMAAPVGATGARAGGVDREGLQRELDGVVAGMAVGVLAEVRDEEGVWRGTSGVAVMGTPRPVPVDGRFRAGSITKTFVATVLLQLVDEGLVRLDDSVERWLPGVVPNGRSITLRQLLNHTSGLYDYVKTLAMPPSAEFFAGRWRTWTASEQISQALAHPPTSEVPGSEYAYSNTGYLLLGQVIQKVTGRTCAKEIDRRLIRPLGLHGTSVPGTSPWIPGPHPHGYVPTDLSLTHYIDYTELNPTLFGASGDMISTTKDLNRFFAALLAGRLLPKHLLKEMETPGTPTRNYGLGLSWKTTTCGLRVYGNDGDALAYNAWSFSTADGRHQVSIALTPNFRGDPDTAVNAFTDKAICG